MAFKPISMHQIRQLIGFLSKGYTISETVRLTGIARNTVREYKRRIEDQGLRLEDVVSMNDEELAAVVQDETRRLRTEADEQRLKDLEGRMEYFCEELRRRGVTMQLLWDEYRDENPQGYGYTQFCEHLSRYRKINGSVMIFTHRPAEQLLVDFAGDTLHYVDRKTGLIVSCQVLVCILPYSNYTYVEALPSQQQEHFAKGLSNALHYYGGVPQSIKTDNMRTVVTRASRYEPVFTEAMDYFGQYHDCAIMATRVRKPRDKASVENAVGVAYKRIYAPLRNEIFYSLKELNAAIRIQLDKHNAYFFKRKNYSRKMVFEAEEKALLKPLPDQPYEIRHTTLAKVQKNYHVILGEDRHQYSVPYTLIGKQLKLIYTTTTVEIYHDQKRVAFYHRNYQKHGHSTQEGHRPSNHAEVVRSKAWDADYFLTQARLIGPDTTAYIQRVLDAKIFPEQTYNSCLGILRLGKHYGPDRLEAACHRALTTSSTTYGIINNILKNCQDKVNDLPEGYIPRHENIRGDAAYQ
jgi:transposase